MPSKMTRNKQIETVRKEILYLIEKRLSPIAMRVRYTSIPLESKMKWKPTVLLIANYSSGKSTYINELVGTKVQQTGQAPTDDDFTVLTSAEKPPTVEGTIEVTEEREGKVLFYDPEFPFEDLQRHGDKLASHFRFKKVAGASILENIALIDTPGMIDAVTEYDRGYDYQETIKDLAQLSDLVLIFFDPHKAGTIRESYTSLRETIPQATFEDRVVFIMNRIDECNHLEDLIRVYGTLCWNLSQMTGRKDIPRILMTYSKSALEDPRLEEDKPFLQYLSNQRNELYQLIETTTRHRLDHLVSFIEYHAARVGKITEIFQGIRKRRNYRTIRWSLSGLLATLIAGSLIGIYIDVTTAFGSSSETAAVATGLATAAALYGVWNIFVYRVILQSYHNREIEKIKTGKPQGSALEQEIWVSIQSTVIEALENGYPRESLSNLRKEQQQCQELKVDAAQRLREAIRHID
ncbi:MAG: dynamin family protein [Zetaproteobacteria bacterium]|nr:dynamin family protein [Zetaproteobacteria bacterium]